MADRNVEEGSELVERAQNGDEAAFSELVRIHQSEVFTLALRLLGDYELAADAAQETFIRAWRALPKFRGDAALSTWLHRITVNTSWTLGRRAQRHNAADIDEVASILTADNLKLMSGVLSESDIKLLKALSSGALNRRRGETRFRKDVGKMLDRLSSNLAVRTGAGQGGAQPAPSGVGQPAAQTQTGQVLRFDAQGNLI